VSDPFDFAFAQYTDSQFEPAVFGNEDGGISNADFDEFFRCFDGGEGSAQSIVGELSGFPATPFSMFDGEEFATFPMDVIPW
jgi:hypothetical protein